MSEKNIVLIPGDGIGTEIIAAAKAVCDVAFEKAGVKVNWIDKKAGGASIDAYGVPLTEDTIEACKNADAVLLGAVGGPKWDNVDPSIRPEKAILGLRKELGLFCNLRPVKIYPSLQEYSPLKKELVQDVDFVIVRELTGGIYFGEREEAQGEGANEFAWDKETYSRYEVERIMDIAMETARKRNKKVVSVDKANVLASSRLWRKIAQEKAAANPDIATDYFYVDNTAMQLVVILHNSTSLLLQICSVISCPMKALLSPVPSGFYHLHRWVQAQHCMSQSTVPHQTSWAKTWRIRWAQSCPQL